MNEYSYISTPHFLSSWYIMGWTLSFSPLHSTSCLLQLQIDNVSWCGDKRPFNALQWEIKPSFVCFLLGNYLPMKMGQCSETLAFKLQTPGNYPKESIQHTEHSESLKSRINCLWFWVWLCNVTWSGKIMPVLLIVSGKPGIWQGNLG